MYFLQPTKPFRAITLWRVNLFYFNVVCSFFLTTESPERAAKQSVVR